MLALSDAAIAGLFALAVAFVGAVATVLVAVLTRESRRQRRSDKSAEQSIFEYEEAWEDRGKIMDGLRHDMTVLQERMRLVEAREQECLEALQESQHRIAVLEARLGVTPGD